MGAVTSQDSVEKNPTVIISGDPSSHVRNVHPGERENLCRVTWYDSVDDSDDKIPICRTGKGQARHPRMSK